MNVATHSMRCSRLRLPAEYNTNLLLKAGISGNPPQDPIPRGLCRNQPGLRHAVFRTPAPAKKDLNRLINSPYIYTRRRRLTGQSGNTLRNLLNPSLRHDSRGAVTFGMTAENKKTLPAEGGDHPATPMPPEFCPIRTGRTVRNVVALRSTKKTQNQVLRPERYARKGG